LSVVIFTQYARLIEQGLTSHQTHYRSYRGHNTVFSPKSKLIAPAGRSYLEGARRLWELEPRLTQAQR